MLAGIGGADHNQRLSTAGHSTVAHRDRSRGRVRKPPLRAAARASSDAACAEAYCKPGKPFDEIAPAYLSPPFRPRQSGASCAHDGAAGSSATTSRASTPYRSMSTSAHGSNRPRPRLLAAAGDATTAPRASRIAARRPTAHEADETRAPARPASIVPRASRRTRRAPGRIGRSSPARAATEPRSAPRACDGSSPESLARSTAKLAPCRSSKSRIEPLRGPPVQERHRQLPTDPGKSRE